MGGPVIVTLFEPNTKCNHLIALGDWLCRDWKAVIHDLDTVTHETFGEDIPEA